MRVTASEKDVLLIENAGKAETARVAERAAARLNATPVHPELDIRGMMAEEAIPTLERYIDSAVMSRLNSVTIIHGKGTGALRDAVWRSLKQNRQAKRFRLGRYGEGENGVTVVELD
jgi:DNA mismatch repair protein MutS2